MYKKIIILFLFAIYLYLSIFNISFYSEDPYINIEIKGAVKQEKLLKVKKGTKVNDVLKYIELCNGDLSSISLNHVFYNNEILVIPIKAHKISINSCSLEDLLTIKHIGPTLAKEIIKYREIIHSFKELDELKNVKGIGEATFEKIKDFLSL